MNDRSSRSHSVFTIMLTQTSVSGGGAGGWVGGREGKEEGRVGGREGEEGGRGRERRKGGEEKGGREGRREGGEEEGRGRKGIIPSLQVLEGEEHSKVSRINLIDLAGSERSSVSQTTGQRLRVRDKILPWVGTQEGGKEGEGGERKRGREREEGGGRSESGWIGGREQGRGREGRKKKI